jgi:hypothetical protein
LKTTRDNSRVKSVPPKYGDFGEQRKENSGDLIAGFEGFCGFREGWRCFERNFERIDR